MHGLAFALIIAAQLSCSRASDDSPAVVSKAQPSLKAPTAKAAAAAFVTLDQLETELAKYRGMGSCSISGRRGASRVWPSCPAWSKPGMRSRAEVETCCSFHTT